MNANEAILMLCTSHASEVTPSDAGEDYQEERAGAVWALERAVHGAVCGCDDKRCALRFPLYDWLAAGSYGPGDTVDSIATEWREVDTD